MWRRPLARSGSAAGIVTAPVGKEQLYGVGFTHPGQTEFIAERCGVAPHNAVMMLAGPALKVVPITLSKLAVSRTKFAQGRADHSVEARDLAD